VAHRARTGKVPLRRRDGSVRAYALVDAADYEVVNRHRWNVGSTPGKPLRASRLKGSRPSRRKVQLAREILGLPLGRYPEVDHINGDTLDCRRSNLRAVTSAQNHQNRHGAQRNSRSGVRGVHWDEWTGKWKAQVKLRGKGHTLGRYDSIAEAEAVAVAFRREHMPYSEMDR
jgi:hypothetical protein